MRGDIANMPERLASHKQILGISGHLSVCFIEEMESVNRFSKSVKWISVKRTSTKLFHFLILITEFSNLRKQAFTLLKADIISTRKLIIQIKSFKNDYLNELCKF